MEIVLKPTTPGPVWRFFSSVWLAIGLMLWVGVLCALGTFADLKEAEVIFFKTRWFGIMLGLLMLNIFIATLNRASKPLYTSSRGFQFPWKISQIPFILVHIGLLLTFGAKIVTASYLIDGQLRLSESQPTDDRLPPQTDNRVYLNKRKIEAEFMIRDVKDGIPPLKDTYLQALTKDGQFVRGQVTNVVKTASGSKFTITEAGSTKEIESNNIKHVAVHDAAPLHLTYLPPTDNLQAGRPGAFWVGLFASAVFVLMAFSLGHFLDSKVAPLISVFVMAALASALYLELPDYKTNLIGNQLEIKYKRYVPHAQPYTSISNDPAIGQNRAVKFFLENQEAILFQKPQPKGTVVNGRPAMVAPVSAEGFDIHYLTVAPGADKTSLFKPTPGTITLSLKSDPSKSVTISDTDAAGKAFKVGDVEVRIENVYKGLVLVENPDKSPGASKHVAQDRGTLSNPALEFRVAGDPQPHLHFAWNEEISREFEKDGLNSAKIKVEYQVQHPISSPCLAIIETEGQPEGELVVWEKDKEPAFFPLKPLQPVKTKFLTHELNVELDQFFSAASVKSDFRNLTAKDHTRFKDFSDAVEIEATYKGKKAEGWLRFGVPLQLRFDESTMVTLNYDYQVHLLDFNIQLTDFNIEFHPGSRRESGFRSKVKVIDASTDTRIEKSADIYMNHTLDYGGYRFFQSSYQKVPGQPDSSIFSVARDPGTPVFYAGCIVLCFGVFVIFFVKPSLLKIEKRLARVAAGLPAEGPITKEQKIAAAAKIKAQKQAELAKLSESVTS